LKSLDVSWQEMSWCKRGERAETAAINVVLGNIVGHLGHEAFKCGVLMQTVHYFPINS
jgi:hypothetical protein